MELENQYLTPTQAAKVLHLSRQRIWQLIDSGYIQSVVGDNGRKWIEQSTVQRMLKARSKK